MVTLKTDKIKDIASKVSMGVDGDRTSPISELLEFELKDKNLTLKTTNKEYFFKTVINDVIDTDDTFHVTIVADTFLSLITKTTVDEIKLDITKAGLVLQGNGKYTFPLVLENDDVLTLPEIAFQETQDSVKFKISGDVLKSIYDFNSRELSKEVVVDPIQKYYYLDNQGALTFVEGACINEFTVNAEPFKVLLNERLVSLFKLFTGLDVDVTISSIEVGKDLEGNPLYQNRIRFKTPTMELTAAIPDSDLVDKYPVLQIRALANIQYPSKVDISKTKLLEALDRLSIFDKKGSGNKVDLKKCGKLEFTEKSMQIISMKDDNSEKIDYSNGTVSRVDFTSYVSLSDLVKHGSISLTDNITLHFGTGDAIMLQRRNLKQVIPELGDPAEYLNTLGD